MRTKIFLMILILCMISVNADLNTSIAHVWTFDENNGTRVNDHISTKGLTASDSTYWEPGMRGSSLNFSATGRYAANSTGLFSGWSAITLSFWQNYDNNASTNLAIYQSAAGDEEMQIRTDSGAIVNYLFTGVSNIPNPQIKFNQATWYHYVITINDTNNEVKIYIDGVLRNQSTPAINIANIDRPFSVGGDSTGVYSTSSFRGRLDELYIWQNRVLNSSDVSELYNSGTGKFYPFSATSSFFDVTALNNYTAGSITIFNASINGTFYSTSNGTINTNLTGSSLVNVSVNATNYFPVTYTNVNLSSNLVANLTPYTAIYANSLVGGNISISNFSLNVTNSSGTTTYTTTSGVIYVPLFNATWNFTLFDAFNATYNFTSDNTSLTGNPYLQEYRFYLYASNTFNIIFRDELNNSIIYTPSGNSSLIQVEFIGDAFSYNFTANGTLTAELLIPQDYIIRYQKDGYGRLRQYFVTLTNQTVQNLTLYMLLDSESEDLTVTAYEQTTLVRIPGSVVYLQRFNVSTNSYSTVAMYETDVAGNAYFDVQKNDELYKFQVDYPWGTSKFVSEAFYIESSEINLYISTIPGFTEGFFEQSGIQGTITYSSSPNTFTLSYSDSSNTATQYCFSIKQWNRYAKEIINQSCSSSASGSMSLTGFTEDGTYYGVFTATIDGTEQVIAASWKDLITVELNAGAFGILLTLGIFLTIIFVFPWHTYAAILGSVGLIFARLFGIFPIDWGYIIAILIASILLGALLENRR